MTAENLAYGPRNIATQFAGFTAIATTTSAPGAAKRTIARRFFTHAFIAKWCCRITFIATSTAIVDIVFNVGASIAATSEIAKSATSATRAARAARGAPVASGSRRAAIAARSHTSRASSTSRCGRRRSGAASSAFDVRAATSDDKPNQTDEEEFMLHEAENIMASRGKHMFVRTHHFRGKWRGEQGKAGRENVSAVLRARQFVRAA